MKLKWIALLTIVGAGLGTGIGFARAVSEVGLTGWDQLAFKEKASAKSTAANAHQGSPQGKPRAVAVPDPTTGQTLEYNFGGMERGAYGEHKFSIRNEGDGVLFLEKLKESCACTKAELDKTELLPGESAAVTMGWDTKQKEAGPLRLTVPVKTNDEDNPLLIFGVSGTLTVKYDVLPKDFSLGDVTRGESKKASVRLIGFTDEPIQVTSHEFREKETAEYFEFSTAPVDPVELPPLAKSGIELTVRSNESLPPGLIRQKVWITHNLDSQLPLEVKLTGNVVGRVRVVGAGWSDVYQSLDLGSTKSGVPIVRKLHLFLHGKEGETLNAEIAEVKPGFLQAELGEGIEVSANVKRFPLTVRVPEDAPPANLRNSATGEGLGTILLKTTLQEVPEMPIRVKLVVTGI